MGLSTGNSKKAISDINVTPLVDVMLVLLVIFMITAPMLEQGIDLNLPEVSAAALPQSDERLTLSIRRDGSVYVDGTRIPTQSLDKSLRAILMTRAKEPVFVEADRDVPYGRVATVLGAARLAGALKLHLVTQEPERP
jgi:biopolymer transport protein TolR